MSDYSYPPYIGWKLDVLIAVLVPLQIISVALRFYARWLVVRTKFALNDILICISLILQLVLSGVMIGSCIGILILIKS